MTNFQYNELIKGHLGHLGHFWPFGALFLNGIGATIRITTLCSVVNGHGRMGAAMKWRGALKGNSGVQVAVRHLHYIGSWVQAPLRQ